MDAHDKVEDCKAFAAANRYQEAEDCRFVPPIWKRRKAMRDKKLL
jgi:hypothetical protein